MSVRAFSVFSAFSALTGFQTLSHQIKVRRSRVIDASWPLPQKNYITATRKIGGWAFGCNVHEKRPLLSCHSCFILLSYECMIGVWSKCQKSPNCETYDCMTSPSAVGFIEWTISCSCGSDMFEFCKPYLHSPHQTLPSAASKFILVDEIFTRWIASCSIDMGAALVAVAV